MDSQANRDAVATMLEELAGRIRSGEVEVTKVIQQREWHRETMSIEDPFNTQRLRLRHSGVESLALKVRGKPGEWSEPFTPMALPETHNEYHEEG
jgi:hypothetical protein